MRLELSVYDQVVASWPVGRESIAAALPAGLEPDAIEGRSLVSLAALRFDGGRLGRAPLPRFSQLNVRTYVRHLDEPAVLFLRSYVTPGGLGGVLLRAPLRAARMSFRLGRVEIPAAGVALAYRAEEGVEPPALGRRELGLFEAAGLREFRIVREDETWHRAVAVGTQRADVLRALGFDPVGSPEVYVATGGSFSVEIPTRKSSPSRSRR